MKLITQSFWSVCRRSIEILRYWDDCTKWTVRSLGSARNKPLLTTSDVRTNLERPFLQPPFSYEPSSPECRNRLHLLGFWGRPWCFVRRGSKFVLEWKGACKYWLFMTFLAIYSAPFFIISLRSAILDPAAGSLAQLYGHLRKAAAGLTGTPWSIKVTGLCPWLIWLSLVLHGVTIYDLWIMEYMCLTVPFSFFKLCCEESSERYEYFPQYDVIQTKVTCFVVQGTRLNLLWTSILVIVFQFHSLLRVFLDIDSRGIPILEL